MTSDKKSKWVIGTLSVVIPVAVAVLLFMPAKANLNADWIYFLPHLIGMLNTTTALALIAGFISIKKSRQDYHRLFMSIAFILGAIFLVVYITYHSTVESTPFGGEGMIKNIYYFFLLSHILLSIGVVPLVLMAFNHALKGRFDKHKKIVKFTLPIWLYVSISGVIVYLLISPYYQF
jgi:putative membrane protein